MKSLIVIVLFFTLCHAPDTRQLIFYSYAIRTGYCNEGKEGCKICCGKWAKYNRTTYGHIPKPNWTIAAHPDFLKKNQIIYVELKDGSVWRMRVEDTGNFGVGIIDWFCETHKKALFKDTVKIWI